ncbi:MAG: hypothetical protein ACLSEX_09020 [Blautia sp.]
MEQGAQLKGASAVIEKDLTSGLLAEELDADQLLILTSVPKVSLNLDTPQETFLGEISVTEAKEQMAAGQFTPGSMLPKIQAGVSFVEKREGRQTSSLIFPTPERLPGKTEP